MKTFYLTLFLDQENYKFISSLHSTREAAEQRCMELMKHFVLEGKPVPPKEDWICICDDCGEAPHVYEIRLDDGEAEEIDCQDKILADLSTADAN
jgi:hypothetical protein